LGWRFHVEVDFSGFPLVADLDEQGGDESKDRSFIGEQTGDASATFDFLVDALQRIGGSEFALMGGGRTKTLRP